MTADLAMARRVALLARPGAASERLRGVLDEAGAQCVLVADPTQLDPAALLDARPQVVLVALDPFTEEVLERFDPVLGDPAIDVIYEEADLAAAREGWAVARWQRHLVAKLLGHADVLPPGREPEAAAGMDAAPSVPASHDAFDPVNAEADEPFAGFAADLPVEFESAPATSSEPFEFDPVFDSVASETSAGERLASGVGEIEFGEFDPVMAELAAGTLPPLESSSAVAAGIAFEAAADEPTVDNAEAAHRFKHDLSDIERRISTLELVDDSPVRGPERARGAVLVLSGIGGPDAVRQLLGALPDDFARPVLVQQRLDGGRYDKLVTQLQRATALPVKLAEPGQSALAGVVYILPGTVGVDAVDGGLRFNDDSGDGVLAALPPADSAVLLLSGSDPAQVDAVMNHSWGGALVAGQAADGCYDAVAPSALAARGGDTASPAKLALRLAERWPSRGTEDAQA